MNIKRLAAFALAVLSAAAVSVAVAGTSDHHADRKDRIYVTNDDGSISLIQRVHDRNGMEYKEVGQVYVGLFKMHWPANQYEGNPDWWWVGVPSSGSVHGFKAKPNAPLADLAKAENQIDVKAYTYAGVQPGLPTSGESFAGVTPNGKEVWNAAREIDEIQEIDSDPHSRTFGQIITHIKVPLSAMASQATASTGRMRPCDMSITPDGKYLFEPDLAGQTVTAVDIKHKKVIDQLQLEPLAATGSVKPFVKPFMLTTNGKIALVETLDNGAGHYAVLDVSDPHHMRLIKNITQADGLGDRPFTDEFSPDGKYAYLIILGSPDNPPQVDVLQLSDLQIVNNIALASDCKPYAGDFSKDGRHFFVGCAGNNTVAVIDTRMQAMEQQVAISGTDPQPRGVIVR